MIMCVYSMHSMLSMHRSLALFFPHLAGEDLEVSAPLSLLLVLLLPFCVLRAGLLPLLDEGMRGLPDDARRQRK